MKYLEYTLDPYKFTSPNRVYFEHDNGLEVNENVRNYCINHWDQYGLTDTKEDFINLLNILAVNGETLDTLTYAVNNGTHFLGYVCNNWVNYRDAAQTALNGAYCTTKACDIFAIALDNTDTDDLGVLDELALMGPMITKYGFILDHRC